MTLPALRLPHVKQAKLVTSLFVLRKVVAEQRFLTMKDIAKGNRFLQCCIIAKPRSIKTWRIFPLQSRRGRPFTRFFTIHNSTRPPDEFSRFPGVTAKMKDQVTSLYLADGFPVRPFLPSLFTGGRPETLPERPISTTMIFVPGHLQPDLHDCNFFLPRRAKQGSRLGVDQMQKDRQPGDMLAHR